MSVEALKSSIEYITNLQNHTGHKIAVYTANLNTYDPILEYPLYEDDIIDYFYISNKNKFPSHWHQVHCTLIDNNPSLTNRYIKFHSCETFQSYKITVYIDANIRICRPLFDFIQSHMKTHNMCIFKHPDRACSYQEARVLRDTHMITFLQQEKFPKQFGMTWNNVILRRNCESVKQIESFWWQVYLKASKKRDQHLLPYVLWKLNKQDEVKQLPLNVENSSTIFYDRFYRKYMNKRFNYLNKYFVRFDGGFHRQVVDHYSLPNIDWKAYAMQYQLHSVEEAKHHYVHLGWFQSLEASS